MSIVARTLWAEVGYNIFTESRAIEYKGIRAAPASHDIISAGAQPAYCYRLCHKLLRQYSIQRCQLCPLRST